MRVLYISGEYPPMRGGVGDYTALIAQEMARLGAEVRVLTSRRTVSPAVDSNIGVDAIVGDWGVGLWQVASSEIASFQPDVVDIQYQTGAFEMRLGVNLLPWLFRFRRPRPKFVVTYHDLKEPYVLPKLGPFRHLATHLLTLGSDAVVVTNPEDLLRVSIPGRIDRTRPLLGSRRLASIPIGSNIPTAAGLPDREGLRARIGARPDEAIIAYFGFIGPTKGVEDLVDAFRLVRSQGVSARLLMVGAVSGDSGRQERGYEYLIRQKLDDSQLRDWVSWTGFVAPTEVGSILGAADVCCLPFRDGVSLRHGTLIAAIAQGMPIVSTIRSQTGPQGLFPKLTCGENILLVEPSNPMALAEGIGRILRDEGLRQQLAAGARKLRLSFSWQSIAVERNKLYEALLSPT